MTQTTAPRLRPVTRVLVLADLAGFDGLARDHDDGWTAQLIDQYYVICAAVLGNRGGRIIKYIGDACHAVFPGEAGQDAVVAVLDLRTEVSDLARASGVALELGASIHRGEVIEGSYGPQESAQFDVIGVAMNHTAMMGRGAGIRISEPVFHQLEASDRARWRPAEPPSTYLYRGA